ncbi:outer membrane beta-barrel protein [Tateyamaria sp. ANG-S1]|uniref:outer membrane protein n=1 Tax=Tateyamaria sp. ANG-S1 TaxID=1577905 RepID=UPI000580044A|nr:outer membrane beta-barrel protein [Tateyamaria sp. ANG-S1]KIC48585.1 membrane protein [Tateyamaria sp. ANG-S1]
MKTRILAIGLAAALAGPALAGSLEPPAPEPAAPAPLPPAPVQSFGGDWTGGYAGLQLGYGDVDGSGAADGDDFLYGAHVGYRYDFGTFVLGGELDYDFADIDLNGAASVDSVARLKLQGGYDFGRTLAYFTAGLAEVDTSLGSESGEFYGIGVAYQINDRYTVGAELLDHNFDDINGTGVDADATTLTVRGSINF